MTGVIVASGFRSERCRFACSLGGRFRFHAATVDGAARLLRANGATDVIYVNSEGRHRV
jgi:hypothetical protein